MRKCIIVSAALAAICVPGALTAADWPQFLGPTANGMAPDTKINKEWEKYQPDVLWTSPMGDDGFAGPSIADGKVFIIDHKGSQDIIRAINIRTSEEVWTYAYEDTSRANWGFARSTPVVDKDRVYALSRLGLLNCLNVKTGKVIWSRDIVKDFSGKRPNWDFAYSPIIDKNKVIVMPGGQGAGVVALDKMTGKTIWQSGDNVPSYATPVAAKIQGVWQYVIFDTKGLQGLNAATGKQLWSFPWKTGSDCNAAAPLVMGNSIFIASGYGHGCAMVDITKEGAKSRWESKEMQAHFSSPILHKGYIYGTGDPGFLMCINPADGKVMWKKEGFGKGTVTGIDGVMLAISGSGGDIVMVKLDPTSYQEMGRTKPLEGDCWTAPAISNGLMIARDKKKIACIALNTRLHR